MANNPCVGLGYSGLKETLKTLRKAKIATSGADENLDLAEPPAVFEVEGKGRVLVYSFASTTSGIPHDWAA